MLRFLDGTAHLVQVELLARVRLLIVEAVRAGVGKEILVAGRIRDGAHDLDAVALLHERMIVLISRTLDLHFVGVLDLECRIDFTAAGGVEDILSLGILHIVGIVLRVIDMLLSGVLEGHREDGEVKASLGLDNPVYNAHGNGVLAGLIFCKRKAMLDSPLSYTSR